MPFIPLPSRDGLRTFARINHSSDSDADDAADPSSLIDPDKPSLVMLHPPMSSGWCFKAQFEDSRLLDAFNLIALDSR